VGRSTVERKKIRRLAATAVVFTAISAAVLATAVPASAATGKNGKIEVGEFGLYWGHNFQSPIFDLLLADGNFSDDDFPTMTSRGVDNNTEAYWNDDSYRWYVYTGAHATGTEGWIPPGYTGNASSKFQNTISSAYYYDAN
jgi:peptidase inhibitor family I36